MSSEPTAITSPAGHLDVTVGESIVLPCQVSHDPTLDLKFTWFFNEQLIHFGSHWSFFEKVGGVSEEAHTEEDEGYDDDDDDDEGQQPNKKHRSILHLTCSLELLLSSEILSLCLQSSALLLPSVCSVDLLLLLL